MTAWVNEVERRLRERAAPLNGEADWPPPVEHGADAWERDKAALRDAHVKLRMTIRDFSPRRLADPVVNDEADGTSFYVMLHGLAQHDAYHAGQIAILKKAAVTTPS